MTATPGTTPAERPVLLAYRALGLGDLLTAVPALRALRRGFPDHRTVLATSGWLAPLVAAIEAVDEHLPVGELAPLPPLRPDVAVNLHGRGPQSTRLLRATEPRQLLTFASPEVPATADAPRWRDDEHEVDRWCRLLAESGLAVDPDALDLDPPAGPTPPAAVGATLIHPGAKAPSRRWPPERFAAVARDEVARGRHVVVTGAAGERRLAEDVAARAGLPATAVLAGRLDLATLARTVAAADRVVCGDTGVAHLATAVGTPSVLLFGPSSPDRWGPPPSRRSRHRVLWRGTTGDPLGPVPDPGLLDLCPADVLEALRDLDDLDDRRADRGGTAGRPQPVGARR